MMSFEPQYKIGREIGAKLVALITIIDDTYDAYGTSEELEPFTEAIQRCDISLIDSFPKGMKVACQAMLDLFREMCRKWNIMLCSLCHMRIAQAFLVEAKWRDKRYTPAYDEYMKNGIINAYPFLAAASFLGLGHIATRELFEWISNDDLPKIIRAISIFARLQNDLGSRKFESKREHVASAVECVVSQYGISEEEAYKLLNKDIENAWKDINEECLKPNSIPKSALDCVVNCSRLIELLYGNFMDRFTNTELLKDDIAAVLKDPIRIE
ncbi:hypothetical protein L6164_028492 [Bauhinia variegata]|uniref:Uncharacterized protein n=1 Tax=Bauhinia variegata TaxID=167791 RepID=A0ACB9L5V2_BAUVA|nr:hypothetical protein L6164_028492 [Bauhinia variegata]